MSSANAIKLIMIRSLSAHTWISTTAALITIFAWLTGIQNVGVIGGFVLTTSRSPLLGLWIAVLLVSVIIVWGAHYILSAIIFAQIRKNAALHMLALASLWMFSVAVGFIFYDGFFGLEQAIRVFLRSRDHSASDFWWFAFAIIFILGFPTATITFANHTAKEWGCIFCGRIALRDIDRRDKGVQDQEQYITEGDGRRIRRVERIANYDIDRKCDNCKAVSTYHKSDYLGHLDYPA